MKLIVWGIRVQYRAEVGRAIICARTKKQACLFLNEIEQHRTTYNEFCREVCATGNDQELALATKEGDVFVCLDGHYSSRNYKHLRKGVS